MKMDYVRNRQIEVLSSRLSDVRSRLFAALDAAQGDQQDPKVQQMSAEFDQLLVEYMRLTEPHRASDADQGR
ncbi:MAG: Spo0E family sporulation regulatory protein-aspartic acid phosphatase [Limnochordales bacterium]|nr:Spo0E family sporulation regulatory protein-aspartic acid phosphatase [Limnochordales bacterium]